MTCEHKGSNDKIVLVERSPEVSVVMAVYNGEKHLDEAINSVLSQSFNNFEFIIVDDGSIDASSDIVKSYNDSRIRFFSQCNSGLPVALNRAIKESKSDLIVRMDQDDICMQDRFACQYDYLIRHTEVLVVGTGAVCIDDNGMELAEIRMRSHPQGDLTLPETPCIHPSVMFRRSAYETAGGYPEIMRFGGEDAVLFNRMLSFGVIVNLPKPLIYYRISSSSMSRKSRKFNRLLRALVSKLVLGVLVSENEIKQLESEYKNSSGQDQGYHFFIGKLLLSNAGQEGKARNYLLKALIESPLSFFPWLLLVASYIPPILRKHLSDLFKKSRLFLTRYVNQNKGKQ